MTVFKPSSEPDVISVCFTHDMDSSGYMAVFPDDKYNGEYGSHVSIERVAKKHGWRIKWFGDKHYNPWRDE